VFERRKQGAESGKFCREGATMFAVGELRSSSVQWQFERALSINEENESCKNEVRKANMATCILEQK